MLRLHQGLAPWFGLCPILCMHYPQYRTPIQLLPLLDRKIEFIRLSLITKLLDTGSGIRFILLELEVSALLFCTVLCPTEPMKCVYTFSMSVK